MRLNCFPSKKCLLALTASLTLLNSVVVLAEESPAPAGETPASTGTPASSDTTAGASPAPTPEPARAPEAKADPKKAAELERGIIEANAQPGSRPAQETRPATASSAIVKPGQPLKLYGRIEELCSGTSAKIPLKMVAMTPVRDTSYDEKPKLTGKATTLTARTNLVASYPIDYRGSWTGDLTINSVNFDPMYYQWDRAEAEKEARMVRPGMRGRCTVNFFQGSDNRIQAEPTQVTFQGTDTLAGTGELSALGAMGGNNPMLANMANMQVPVMFNLHLGAPIQSFERGVTGNQLSKELMKNTLRELTRGVLEQQVVTKDLDKQAGTGKTRVGYSESVLRFTRISSSQLYLQAAYVYYRNDGKFLAKYILYGTLNKASGYVPSATTTNPFGTTTMPVNPFGSMMPGLGGGGQGSNPAGSMQDAANAMQKLLQQMGGR